MRPISRRAFLRGAGASVALPLLDAMRPSLAFAQQASPQRFLAYYVPNGIHMAAWTPAQTGANWDLTPILAPLAAVREHVTVLSGISNDPARPDGPGDHAAGTGTFLTCRHVYKTEGANIRNGVSFDQVLVGALGGDTLFPSLQLGAEGGGSTGNCDSGYSCAYSRNISWSGEATPLHKEVNPRSVFDRIFQGGDPRETVEQVARRRRRRVSILDFVRGDATRLQAKLGRTDRRKLDEYLTGIRELERRIEAEAEAPGCDAGDRPEPAEGLPERLKQMADLMVVALRCDLTRIITFMLGNAGSNRAHRFLDIAEGHHEISHHQGLAANHQKLQVIDTWEMEELAYLLQRLRDTPDGEDSSLLDNTAVFWSSEIEDGNTHAHRNLPVLLAGGLGGRLSPGRHVRYQGRPPMANLFIDLAGKMGVPLETFGDNGTGPIGQL